VDFHLVKKGGALQRWELVSLEHPTKGGQSEAEDRQGVKDGRSFQRKKIEERMPTKQRHDLAVINICRRLSSEKPAMTGTAAGSVAQTRSRGGGEGVFHGGGKAENWKRGPRLRGVELLRNLEGFQQGSRGRGKRGTGRYCRAPSG